MEAEIQMNHIFNSVGELISVIITSFGFGGAIVIMLLKNFFVEKKEFKKISEVIVTREQLDKEQSDCQKHLCEKIDKFANAIQSQIAIIDAKREHTRDDNLKFLKAIYKHMGAVENFMEIHEKRMRYTRRKENGDGEVDG